MKNVLLITFTLLAFVLKAQIVVTKSGTVPAASASDVNAGTSTTECVTPSGLAGSNYIKSTDPVPANPGSITASAFYICPGQTGVTYSISADSGATGYLWSVPAGASITSGAGTNSITVAFDYSAITGPIFVTPYNSAGFSASSSESYAQVNNAPPMTSSPTIPIAGSSVTFSISGPWFDIGTYTFYKNGSAIYTEAGSSESSPTYTVSSPTAGDYYTITYASPGQTCTPAQSNQIFIYPSFSGTYVPLNGNFRNIAIESGLSGADSTSLYIDSTYYNLLVRNGSNYGNVYVDDGDVELIVGATDGQANINVNSGGSYFSFADTSGSYCTVGTSPGGVQITSEGFPITISTNDLLTIAADTIDIYGTQINHGDIHLPSNNNMYFGNSNTYARYDAGLKGLSLYSYDATSTNGNSLALEPGGVVLSAQHGYPFPSASSTLDLTSTKLTVDADTTNIIGLLLNNGSPISGGSSFTGGTLTSPLILAGDPTTALGAATKQYVDNNYVPFSFTGNEAISSTGNLGVVAGGAMSFTSSGNLNLNPGGTAKVNGNNILTTTNIDAIPTSGSTNVAGSGGVYNQLVSVSNALAGKPGLTTNNTLTGTNTFTGEVIVPTPVNSTDATTKTYVDAQCGNYVPLNGTVSNINISSGSYLRTDYEQIVMDSTQFKVAGYGQVDLSSYTEGGGYPYADLNLLDGNIVLQSVGSSKSSIVSLYTDSISLAADTIDINGVLLNNGSAVQTQNNNSIVLIGDSYIAFHLGGSAPSVTVAAMGYFNWANMLLGKRFHVLQYAGIGGQTTTQILARFKTDALALNPGWILFDGGINDINAGASATTIFNNLKAMIQASQGIGAKVILTTIPIIRAWSSSQANRNVAHSVNAMLKQYCRELNNVILIDWNPLLLSTTDGMISSNYTFDNTHLNLLGNAIVGDYMANILQSSLPYYDALPWSLDDEYTTNTDYAHTNLVLNGMLTGTTGYPSSTNVATNWKISSSFLSGGGTSAYNTDYISSKVNALRPSIPDYRSFDFQQIQILPSNGIEKDITFWPSTTTIGSQFSVGDWVYAECEFEADADWNAVSRFQLRLSQGGGGTNADSDDLFGYAANGNGNFPGATSPVYIPRKGTFRTYPFQLTTGNTYLYPAIDFYGIAGTVRIGRMAIRKATPVTVGTKTVFYY